jgi:FAD synthetase
MKRPRVLVFGTFDVLHPGHLAMLRRAAREGDVTAVVARDARVRAEKGKPPVFGERDRLAVVASLRTVSKAVLGDRKGEWSVVRRLRPDVICVGHDQRADAPEFLAQLGAFRPRPRIVRLPAFRRGKYSSTELKKRLARR